MALQTPESRTELSAYLATFKRWWWLLVAGVAIVGVAADLVTRTITPIYSASATSKVAWTEPAWPPLQYARSSDGLRAALQLSA